MLDLPLFPRASCPILQQDVSSSFLTRTILPRIEKQKSLDRNILRKQVDKPMKDAWSFEILFGILWMSYKLLSDVSWENSCFMWLVLFNSVCMCVHVRVCTHLRPLVCVYMILYDWTSTVCLYLNTFIHVFGHFSECVITLKPAVELRMLLYKWP